MANQKISETAKLWYLDNFEEILGKFKGHVDYDDILCTWILIKKFHMPSTFFTKFACLLICTPGDDITNLSAYSFYTDLNLERLDGAQLNHLFDGDGYNPYKNLGYSRLSYHLEAFNPSYPIYNGDTILDICQSVYHFLGKKWW